MNESLAVVGILLGVAGAFMLVWTRLYPEAARRENRRVRNLTERARDAGLRGRFRFEEAPSGRSVTGGHESYEPADNEDRALFDAVGAKMEGDAAFFANEMLWTDYRFAWAGVPMLIIGIALLVTSGFV
jgi:hypothetical protein